ncbi:DUF6194 family protein [Nocardia beijingensis]|uniref:DUF6194 family protein n=1 Tax=Nocardia beijingensis TaxID=95162 RepID=A0ABW7WQQ9_9NOCA
MTIEEIIGFVSALEGVLTLRPGPGDGSPEISWGDTFFYYSPDGVVPKTTQPFATIVTKNYPGDESSDLNRPNTFRVNIAAGKEAFTHWTGHTPRESSTPDNPSAVDTLLPHPVYASAAWLAVINPGPRTAAPTRTLLNTAYELARTRHQRRTHP